MQAPVDTTLNTENNVRTRRRSIIQSLDRGLVILESVAKSGHAVSLAELAQLFDIDRSTAFRLADTLKRRGFLSCPRNSKGYALGPSMWRLAQACDWNDTLVKISRPFLQFLANQTRETAHLAIREGREALFIDNVLGNHLITVSGQVGELVPLHCTAHGKALLADYDGAQLRVLLGGGQLKGYTEQTITSLDRLTEACAHIRSQGYVMDDSEYQLALRCVAAPVRDHDGEVVGSIGISAPVERMPEHLRGIRAMQVLKAAHDIHAVLSMPARRSSAAANSRT